MSVFPEEHAVQMNLDGNAYIDLGTVLNLNISFQGNSPYTFECWVRPQGADVNGTIFSKDEEFILGIKGGCIYMERTGQIGPLQGSTTLKEDVWYYVAVSYDGQTITLYLNGDIEASMVTHDEGTPDKGHSFQLANDGGDTLLNCAMSSFRAWNVARDQEAIWQAAYEPPQPQIGLIAFYDFTQLPARDISGHDNPITLSSGAVSQYTTPGLYLNNNAYADPSDEADINPGGSDPYSIQSWLFLSQTSGQQSIFANGDFNANSGIAFYVENGILKSQRGASTGQVLSSATTLLPDTWYNVATTYDGTSLCIYINGALDASGQFGAIETMPDGDVLIGAAMVGTSPSMFFQGYMQSMAVWTKALSINEIGIWMTQKPFYQANQVAIFDFTMPPSKDLSDGHSIVEKNGAIIQNLLMTPKAGGGYDFTSQPLVPPPPPPEPHEQCRFQAFKDNQPKVDHFSEAHKKMIMDEFDHFLSKTPKKIQDLHGKTRAKLRNKLDEVFKLAKENPDALPGGTVKHEIVDDHHVISYHHKGQSIVLFKEHVDDIDPCVVWVMTFIYTLLTGVMDLFGIPTPASKIKELAQQLWNNPAFQASLRTILGATFTAGSILSFLRLLYDFGFLKKFLWMCATSISWWAAAKILAKLITWIFGTEVAVAYFIAQTVVLVAKLIVQIAGFQQACGGDVPQIEGKAA